MLTHRRLAIVSRYHCYRSRYLVDSGYLSLFRKGRKEKCPGPQGSSHVSVQVQLTYKCRIMDMNICIVNDDTCAHYIIAMF